MKLNNNALVGKLSITNWEAKKKARGIEAKAEHDSGAKQGTISARKSLLPGATELDDIIKHSAAMRTWWNTVSAPWFDNGMRIYGIAGHFDIQVAYGDMARHRDGLVDAFIAKYAELRETARFDLNDLFDETDYPKPQDVRSRFTCSFEVMPLPSTEDFRVVEGISEEEIERLTAQANTNAEARIKEASRTAVERLHGAVKTMADRLDAYTKAEDADTKGARFYDSWVLNVQELAALIPQLNITGDPTLAALASEAAEIAAGEANTFRFDRELRSGATLKAQSIAARLANLFSDE
jgi:hypothetical protein